MKILFFIVLLTSVLFSQISLEEIVQITNSGQTDKALVEINKFIDNNSNNDRGYFVKALILTDKKDYSAAVFVLEKAISLLNSNPEYYRLLGQLNENLDRTSKAISAWSNCKKYSSDHLKAEAEKHLRYLSNE